jgi:hypothetical protein
LLARSYKNQLELPPDMKKMFLFAMLISVAMICSCQKQDSAAEGQLAQRKAELDQRENALDQRENALVEREKALAEREKVLAQRERALAEREKAMANSHVTPEQAKAETDSRIQTDPRIQQLPPEAQALVPDRSRIQAERAEKEMQDQQRSAPRELGPEDLQRQWQSKLNKAKMSGEAVSPAVETTSPTPSPTPE